jgi:hypothetical protein
MAKLTAEHQALLGAAKVLANAVHEYVSERDNPAPDYTMRRLRFEDMRAALDAYEKAGG